MDTTKQIEPHKITKPIQLLAAWLAGLVLVNGSFLVAATQIPSPPWVPGALALAGIVNVPLFLVAIFLLQTKFRPEMQEDSFYSKYLESRITGNTEREVTAESFALVREDISKLEQVVAEKVLNGLDRAELRKAHWSAVTVRLNKSLTNFTEIARTLTANDIPVHETFGGGAGSPDILNVAIGSGFDVDQIKTLVDALLKVTDGWISYAFPDDEDYRKQVLIGAYGNYKHGIMLSRITAIIQHPGITTDEIYRHVGIGTEV